MRLNRNLSIILVILFILVTSYTAVEVISLPSKILSSINITENSSIERAENESILVFILLGIDLLIVLIIIFILSTGSISSKGENIIYIERESSKKEDLQVDNQNIESLYIKKIKESQEEISQLSESNNEKFLEKALSILCNELEGSIGAIYRKESTKDYKKLKLITGYAFFVPESEEVSFEFGEGLIGQVGKSKKATIFSNVPDNYIKITSGLGNSTPKNLIVVPLVKDNQNLQGVIEIASFKPFLQNDIEYLESISNLLLEKLV